MKLPQLYCSFVTPGAFSRRSNAATNMVPKFVPGQQVYPVAKWCSDLFLKVKGKEP